MKNTMNLKFRTTKNGPFINLNEDIFGNQLSGTGKLDSDMFGNQLSLSSTCKRLMEFVVPNT